MQMGKHPDAFECWRAASKTGFPPRYIICSQVRLNTYCIPFVAPGLVSNMLLLKHSLHRRLQIHMVWEHVAYQHMRLKIPFMQCMLRRGQPAATPCPVILSAEKAAAASSQILQTFFLFSQCSLGYSSGRQRLTLQGPTPQYGDSAALLNPSGSLLSCHVHHV